MKNFDNFIEKVTPVLKKLANKWFQPGLRNEDGIQYGCLYCDLECGGSERHDSDCLSDLAKKVLDKLLEIDSDKKLSLDYKGEVRNSVDLLEIKDYMKGNYILKHMYSPILADLIPINYEDKYNKNIVCYCNSKNWKVRKHAKDCEIVELAQALANLYSLNE